MRQVIKQMVEIESVINMIYGFGQRPHIAVHINPRMMNVPEGRQPVSVPMDYVKEEKILLNICMTAIQNFVLDKEDGYIHFTARFRGVAHNITIPLENICYIRNEEDEPGCKIHIRFDRILDWNKLVIYKHPSAVENKVVELPVKKPNPFTVVK